MLFTSALPFVAALATLATAVEAKTPFMDHHYESHSPAKPLTSSVNSTPFLKHQPHHKRLLCGLLGLFCGADYSSDVNNCGSSGRRCTTSWLNGSGAQCVNGVCGAASCNAGFAFSWTAGKCTNILTDIANCGSIGNVCATSFALTQGCSAGSCIATSCQTGYTLAGGVCTRTINLLTDMSNCGALGNKCASSYSNGVGSVCSLGVCQPLACSLGYAFDYSTKQCRNIYSDTANCGAVGTACAFPHGTGSCVSGICVLTGCNSGYYNILGTCIGYNLQTDENNCGAVGAKCSFNNGYGICSAGVCTFTQCLTGFALSGNKCNAVDTRSDVNNCGSVGNRCQSSYLNGGVGQCISGLCFAACSSGYTWDSTWLFCRQTSSDILNCGGIGNVCAPTGALAAMCASGSCYATACLSGYSLVSGSCNKIDTTSDVNNCGFLGRACTFLPVGATGICSNSQCKITACPTKYALNSAGICVASAVSQRARVKKATIVKPTLCPAGETACPIANSASFEMAVNHHFSAPKNEYSGIMSGDGGYECLDTTQALESCGGCASTGEGQDCTKIPHAGGVGCDAGICHVFSCSAGFHPNLAGTKCVKAAAHVPGGRNASRRAARRRHLGHAHGHHGAIHS